MPFGCVYMTLTKEKNGGHLVLTFDLCFLSCGGVHTHMQFLIEMVPISLKYQISYLFYYDHCHCIRRTQLAF